jgi:glycyl-tRNA synthetase beta chain
LKDQGYAHDEILAVLAVASGDVYDTARRVAAVKAFRATEGGADLAIAFKRAANLSDAAAGTGLDASLLTDAERALEAAIDACVAPELGGPGGTDPDYSAALEEIARLRAPVDEFFEKVLVMDPDPAVRRNRLALLNRLVGLFDRFAGFRNLAG